MNVTEETLELSEAVSRRLFCASPGDGGLGLIRRIPQISARARGNCLHLKGPADQIILVKRFVKILGRRLEVPGDGDLDNAELERIFTEFTKPVPASGGVGVLIHEEPFDEVICTLSGKSVRTKTFKQQEYVEAIRHHLVTVAVGPAGTGKTYLAIAMAVKALRDKQVSRVILSRPTVEAGEKLGYLPGDLLEKVDPHFRPLYDALQEFFGVSRFQQLLRQGILEITPLGFMRGRTFNEAFIVLDEAQNTTVRQMRMFLTRMGFGSRVVVTGDRTQVDLPSPRDSALVTLRDVLGAVDDIAFVDLSASDVIRHELVKKIIRAYENFFREAPEQKEPGATP